MFSYRVQTLINAKGQITTYTYDANGNKLTETNYLANTKQYRYDGINRLIEEKDALGNVVQQLEYNDANAQLYSYDVLLNKTIYHNDKNMRNIGITDAEGNTTSSTMIPEAILELRQMAMEILQPTIMTVSTA